jgi:hypothetical protein
MVGKLATWAIVLGLALPVYASERPGAIAGYVRDVSGVPQMGAVVEILNSAAHTLTVFTDGAGYYSATGLLPGFYTVKVSAPSFLPALRERIGLRPGATLSVNVTLKTLLGVLDVGPIRTTPDDDDWKWTLRSVANRPVLRIFSDPNAIPEKQDHELRGTLSFLAGSAAGGYGSGSDMSTGFTLERPVFSAGLIGLSGNVGYGVSAPAAVLRTSYAHRLPDGSGPSFAMSVRRFAPSDPNLHNAALQALALSAGDDLALNDVVELKFGSELQTIQFLGRVNDIRPYGFLDIHLSPNTVLEYDYTTSLPSDPIQREVASSSSSSSAESGDDNPRVSVANFVTKLERDNHQELSVSRRMGATNLQLAAFSDRVGNTALTGMGEVTAASGFLLPDVYSGTFSYTGNRMDTNGLRLVLQRKLCSDLTATLDYAYGGALSLATPDIPLENAQPFITTHRRHAAAAKFSGTIPHARTRWIASYRWVSGQALTPVDMFNASAGQSDPYLNFFIRQPIPSLGFLPGHMEAIIDIRNLLAQGYVPVIGQDGQTVYLVQAARSVRGGVAFTF